MSIRKRKKRPFQFREDYAVRISNKMWLAVEFQSIDGYWSLALVRNAHNEEPRVVTTTLTPIEEEPDASVVYRLSSCLKTDRRSLQEAIRTKWPQLHALSLQVKQKCELMRRHPKCVGNNEKRITDGVEALKKVGLAIPETLLRLVDETNWARDLIQEEIDELELVDDLMR